MDVERAVDLSSALGMWLNGENPVLPIGDGTLVSARKAFQKALEEQGLLERMDGEYRDRLFSAFRVLDGEAFMKDPYLQSVQLNGPQKEGNFLLTEVRYQKGELLQYRMPDYEGEYPALSVGCFSSPVRTLALYENGMPWLFSRSRTRSMSWRRTPSITARSSRTGSLITVSRTSGRARRTERRCIWRLRTCSPRSATWRRNTGSKRKSGLIWSTATRAGTEALPKC